MRRLTIAFLAGAICSPTLAQQVEVESFVLDNGMEFLLVPRSDQPNNIAAGWMARVGSVNEQPGMTGISHFFEHLMFKGTTTIGTSDPQRDAELRDKQEQIKKRIHELTWGEQYQRYLNGEIDDPWDDANDSDELRELKAELKALMEQHGEIIVKDEFSKVYTNLGGSGMNAFTTYDLTFYFINVPSNKFELWAWMESDRLTDSVFREFYAERDVVHEERRLRTESTPTGIFQEQFNAMFWQSSPYSWPVIGWTSDLNSYTLEKAKEFYDIYYGPNNLVGVIVGDFNPAEIKPVIESYFGRLERGTVEPEPVVTLEMEQIAEKRMYAECDCQPAIEIRYHAVPFSDTSDRFALEMMVGVLNGRTGRLYKALIEGKRIASSASTGYEALRLEGAFSFNAEVKGDATPEQLEQAWYEELERLQTELVSDRELQKVKNQEAANAYRRLQSNFFLLVQLGYYEALGGWEHINTDPVKLQEVTAEDIQRVANTYFDKTNRNVVIYNRKAGTSAEVDPDLAALEPNQRAMLKQVLAQLDGRTEQELTLALTSMQAQASQVPEQDRAVFNILVKKVQERLDEIKALNAADTAE